MWLEKVAAALIAVLLTAMFLAGCKTDGSFDNVADSAPSAAPQGKGSPAASNTQPTSNGITPSFNSTAQEASNRVSPKQNTAAIRDPSAAQAADALASVATPGIMPTRSARRTFSIFQSSRPPIFRRPWRSPIMEPSTSPLSVKRRCPGKRRKRCSEI